MTDKPFLNRFRQPASSDNGGDVDEPELYYSLERAKSLGPRYQEGIPRAYTQRDVGGKVDGRGAKNQDIDHQNGSVAKRIGGQERRA